MTLLTIKDFDELEDGAEDDRFRGKQRVVFVVVVDVVFIVIEKDVAVANIQVAFIIDRERILRCRSVMEKAMTGTLAQCLERIKSVGVCHI